MDNFAVARIRIMLATVFAHLRRCSRQGVVAVSYSANQSRRTPSCLSYGQTHASITSQQFAKVARSLLALAQCCSNRRFLGSEVDDAGCCGTFRRHCHRSPTGRWRRDIPLHGRLLSLVARNRHAGSAGRRTMRLKSCWTPSLRRRRPGESKPSENANHKRIELTHTAQDPELSILITLSSSIAGMTAGQKRIQPRAVRLDQRLQCLPRVHCSVPNKKTSSRERLR